MRTQRYYRYVLRIALADIITERHSNPAQQAILNVRREIPQPIISVHVYSFLSSNQQNIVLPENDDNNPANDLSPNMSRNTLS